MSGLYKDEVCSVLNEYYWDDIYHPTDFISFVKIMESKDPCLYLDLGPSGTSATFVKYNLSENSNSITHHIYVTLPKRAKTTDISFRNAKNQFMNPMSAEINLIREKQKFRSCVALVKGELSELMPHLKLLHPNELDIFNQYKYDRRKSSYLLGRLAAKEAIQKLTHCDRPESIWIDSGVFQFPVVRCSDIQNIQVSISHSQDIGLSIAFPEAHPMGVDLEMIEEDKTDVVLSQISNEEQDLLRHIDENNIGGYFCLFSIKEALSKVIKTGMMLDFKFLKVNKISMNQDIMEATFAYFGQYRAFSYHKKNYAFSFALPKKTKIDNDEIFKILNIIDDVLKRDIPK